MGRNEIFEKALDLHTTEKFLLIEELLKSLDKPDIEINKVWEDEAQKRLDLYKQGKIEALSEEEFFSNEH
ncbi:addiction module protein [Arcobacter sp. YIC-310]|uniref:addiction module protein n=1 Tax=Arcobacter sp. YIC-310 TaxID=3376632 RepID=UPI003C145B61